MNLLSCAPHNPDYEAFSMEAGLEARFAFTAQFWGNGAVVCRAVENRPEPVVEQQFGQFPTWTQANTCASKLNEGLGLDPLDVRQIVTSSFLATACIIQTAVASLRPSSSIKTATQAAELRFLAGELSLALTFCRSASLVAGPAPSAPQCPHSSRTLPPIHVFVRWRPS